jgi:GntR family histidine utilization transcriptional repressor
MSVLHQKIRDDIENRIRSGEMRPGQRIPTEHDLMQAYGCARMTVNKALSRLAADGLIERRKRAGSFVRLPRLDTPVLEIPDIEVEVTARGDRYRFDLLTSVTRNDSELNGPVLSLIGVHYAQDRALAFEERRISLTAVPEAATADFTVQSPGHWLLQAVPWTRVEHMVSALAAPASIAARLGVDRGAACLVIERRTWKDDAGVTIVRQVFDGTAYRLTASFGK